MSEPNNNEFPKHFRSAFEMALWINDNVKNPLKQESLFYKGLQNNYTLEKM